jgi:hypothetical protein
LISIAKALEVRPKGTVTADPYPSLAHNREEASPVRKETAPVRGLRKKGDAEMALFVPGAATAVQASQREYAGRLEIRGMDG